MSYVDTTRAIIRIQLNDIERRVREARAKAPAVLRAAVQEFVDRQAGGLGVLVPDGLVDELADIVISAALAALDQSLETIAALREANEMLGSPDKMRSMAGVLDGIASASDNLQIRKDQLPGLLAWDDGTPSRTYEFSIDDQVRAVSEIAGNVSSVSGVLRTHADDIESYYLNLAGLVVGAVIAIGGLIAAILSFAGGALTAGTGIGAVLGIIGGALSLVMSAAGVIATGISALQLFLAASQGSANKLNDLITAMPEWKAPSFAIVQ